MGLNETINADRLQIGFFGRTNAGKSSIVNAITGQSLSIVSAIPGTTTDPVQKAMELLPIGPVLIIDTPGYDDESILGVERVNRANQVLNRIAAAVLVVDATIGKTQADSELLNTLKERNIPFIVAYSKKDILSSDIDTENAGANEIYVSVAEGKGIKDLKELMGRTFMAPSEGMLVSDIIKPGEYVLLVVPIDGAAPKGRLILPQQKVIRDILDAGAKALVVKENEVRNTFQEIGVVPSLVITDSQVFGKVSREVPEDIRLTSFSILMARYNGFLDIAVRGADVISTLKNEDTILISEGCTHHRQCGDIGSVKIPAMLNKYTGCKLNYEYSSGGTFPDNLTKYKLVIHCGGCMLNEKQMNYRMRCAKAQSVPVTNYGIAIAYMKGILTRSSAWIPEISD